MNDTIYTIIDYLVKIICLILAVYVIPAIKHWLESKLAWNKAMEAVKAAQQVFGPANGDECVNDSKLLYALAYAQDILHKYHINMTDDQIQDLIQSAVYTMKNGKVE